MLLTRFQELDKSRLFKVVIRRQSLNDPLILHDNEADGISEGPGFITPTSQLSPLQPSADAQLPARLPHLADAPLPDSSPTVSPPERADLVARR